MTTAQDYKIEEPAAMGALESNLMARLGEQAEAAMKSIVAVNMLALMLLTLVDVIGRYFFGRPVAGALEITEMLLAACIATSLPGVMLRDENVSIDLFDRLFQLPVVRAVHRPAVGVVVSICCAFIAWRLWDLAGQQRAAGETTAQLGIPMYFVAYAMAVMVTVSTVVSCLATVGIVSTPGKGEPS